MKEKYQSFYNLVGENVKDLRKKKEWTQDELASRCSVNREKISRIENGRKDYLISTLLEIAEALNVDFEVLIKPGI